MTCPFCGKEMVPGTLSAPIRRITWEPEREPLPFVERIRRHMEESVSIPLPVKRAYRCAACRKIVMDG